MINTRFWRNFLIFLSLKYLVTRPTIHVSPGQGEDEDHHVIILSKPFQCFVIIIIFLVTVVSNCSIILNISKSDVKSRVISFILIKNLCIVDLCGAILILPVPFIATWRGKMYSLSQAFPFLPFCLQFTAIQAEKN